MTDVLFKEALSRQPYLYQKSDPIWTEVADAVNKVVPTGGDFTSPRACREKVTTRLLKFKAQESKDRKEYVPKF